MKSSTDLLTTQEAARRLGLTDARVRQLCIRGELRAVKVGRDWAITPEDFAKYEASRKGNNR